MATQPLKSIISLLLSAFLITCAASARILLDEDTPEVLATAPKASDSVETPVSTGANPAAAAAAAANGAAVGASPAAAAASGAAVGTSPPAAVAATGAAVGTSPPAAASATGAAVGASPAAAASAVGADHTLVFFMHDIIGGSNPSARAVTGVVTNPAVNGQVPFAKPNGAVLPLDSGVPVNSANSGIINNNNIPFLTGLGGTTANAIQNNGGNGFINNGIGYPVLNAAQLPTGNALQKLMFGTLTAFDDELTEGHELGSGLIGKAQGFYIASSVDGTSQTMAFTALFESGSYADSLSFFGVHRTAVSESHLAIMGGTGKYVNAKGYATVKTFPGVSQHNTDGLETLLQIIVYLA